MITGLRPGGAENQLQLLLRHTRHDAEVVTLTNPGAVAEGVRAEGTPVINMGMRGNRDLSVLRRLRLHFRRSRPDIVHVHLYRACVYGRLAARLAGVPRVVTTEHSLGDRYIEGRRTTPWIRLLYLATARLSDVTIAVSDGVRRRLLAWGLAASSVVNVPNGIDLEAVRFDPDVRRAVRGELGIAERTFLVGAVGRLDPVKRFDLLIEAVAKRLGPGCRLVIVGEGPARRDLEQQALRLEVSGDVLLPGERSDVPRLLSAMDLLAAPSSSETFGLAVIEALGAGLPVIYTECPALAALPDGGGPRARRVSAEVETVSEALDRAIAEGPGDREPPASVVRGFDIRVCAEATDQIYDSLQ